MSLREPKSNASDKQPVHFSAKRRELRLAVAIHSYRVVTARNHHDDRREPR